MAFYVNFDLRKIEDLASHQGFVSATWKQDLLNDLLFDDMLRVEKSVDPRDASRTVWHIKGRIASIAAAADYNEDALFCINVVEGPEAGGIKARTRVADVPGPWRIATRHQRPKPGMSVTEHVEKYFAAPRLVASGTSRSTPLTQSPFSALGARLPAAPAKASSSPTPAQAPPATGASAPITAFVASPARGAVAPVRPAAGLRTDSVGAGAKREEIRPEPPNSPAPVIATAQDTLWIASRQPDAPSTPNGEAPEVPPPGPPDRANTDSQIPPAWPSELNLEVNAQQAAPNLGLFSVEPVDGKDWNEVAVQLLTRESPSLAGILDESDPREARRQRISRLESDLARIQDALARVPTDAQVSEADAARRRVIDLGIRCSPTPPARITCGSTPRLESDLTIAISSAFACLPPWVVDGADASSLLTTFLQSQAVQERVRNAVRWIDQRFAGAPPPTLRDLPPPTNPTDVADALEDQWRAAEELATAFARVPAPWRPVILRVGGAPSWLVTALTSWQDLLGSDAFAELLQETAAADQPRAFLEMLPDPPDGRTLDEEARENLKDIRSLKRAVRVLASPTVQTLEGSNRRPAPPAKAEVLDFGHAVTDERGGLVSATIFVPTPGAGDRFVRVDLPVRIVASSQLAHDVVVRVTSAAIDGVPREAQPGECVPVVTLEKKAVAEWLVPAATDRWKEFGPARYLREEVLHLPITIGVAKALRESKRGDDLSIRLTIGTATSQLKFTKFLGRMPTVSAGAGLGDATATELVRTRPMGAQIQHEKLEGVVSEGRQSFMVVAPRRFGKTTLFKHLAAHARSVGHAVIAVALQREGTTEEGVGKVWAEVRRSLEDSYGFSPALGETLPTSLFDIGAWTRIRRFVAERGAKALVVLVDEAQVLVPRTEGPRWGNQLKTSLEMHLSEPADGFAVVQIALFGTVDLSVRLGQNCRDFLLTYGSAQYDFDEASLARFLRQVGQGAIESSPLARSGLARWTNNLRTLEAVFDQIRARLIASHRLFLLDRDVEECVEHLLGRGEHLPELWNYARSELSYRDEPWDPIDAFPLAVAWARRDFESLPAGERLEAAVGWLNGELRDIGIQATVPAERAKAALADLRARGVVRPDGPDFYRPLLHELLKRKTAILRQDPENHLALMRLAVDTVVWPDGAQERGEGGQAKVYLADRGDRPAAYRACDLATDESRRRFARTCAALRALRDRRTNIPGDEHLPRVSEAGFRADDPSQGVIVYDWVEGETFDAIWAELPLHGRAYVVKQLAKAVTALHARDVLHCDIAPRNIIVNSRLEATLIDFGLARRADTTAHTRLPEDRFKAPEQTEAEPSPAKESDVYALGVLLRGPGSRASDLEPFSELVARMLAQDVAARPSASQVRDDLEALVQFEPGLHQLGSKVEDIINDAPEALWDDLLQFKWQAATALGGFVPWDSHRAMEVAFALNNLFVRLVTERRGTVAASLADIPVDGDLSLAAVGIKVQGHADADVRRWSKTEVLAVGLLRIAWAHPKDRKRKITEARKTLVATDSNALAEFRRALATVAAMLDELADSSDVMRRFVKCFGVE